MTEESNKGNREKYGHGEKISTTKEASITVLRDLLMGLEFLYRQQSLLIISCFLQRRNEPPLSYPDNLTQKFGLTLVRVAKSIIHHKTMAYNKTNCI